MPRLAAFCFALALLAAACGESDDSGRASPTSQPAATSSPTSVALPPRPGSLRDYARTVAAYLTADPQEATRPATGADRECLRQLYIDWRMPRNIGANGCRLGNTDADPEPEVIVAFTDESGTPDDMWVELVVAIFDRAADGFHIAYETPPAPFASNTSIRSSRRAT